MAKVKLSNLKNSETLSTIALEKQHNILGGDRFSDGELDTQERQVIGIFASLIVNDKPEVLLGVLPEYQENYPDIYNGFIELLNSAS